MMDNPVQTFYGGLLYMSKTPSRPVEEQLQEITGVTRNEGEEDQAYLMRLFMQVNDAPQEDWEKLDDTAQRWANACADANDAKEDLPMFDGTLKPVAAKAPASEGAAAAPVAKKSAKAKSNGNGAAKPKVAAKKAAAKKPANGESRGRKGTYPLDATITVKVKENPHRAKSKDFAKFKALGNGATVEKALKAGADWGYLRYAAARDLIAVK